MLQKLYNTDSVWPRAADAATSKLQSAIAKARPFIDKFLRNAASLPSLPYLV